MLRRPVSVTELAGYTRRADELLTEAERDAVVDLIAYDPTRGDLMAGTGGLHKLRVGLSGSGKRGGARVIYYFYHEDVPVLLMAIYAKNEKADLSDRDKKKSVQYAKEFMAQWRRR